MNISTYTKENGRKHMSNLITFQKKEKKNDKKEIMLNLINFQYEQEERRILWKKKRDEFGGCGRERCQDFVF